MCRIQDQRECVDPTAVDVADLAFLRYGYDSCEDALSDNDCGVDAEALRSCLDALEQPLCVPPTYQGRELEALFAPSPCAEAFDTFVSCEQYERSHHSRQSSSDWDDWDD